jgi:hypothetical protein
MRASTLLRWPGGSSSPRVSGVFCRPPLDGWAEGVVLWGQLVPRARAPVVGTGGYRQASADPRGLWGDGVEVPAEPPRPALLARGEVQWG